MLYKLERMQESLDIFRLIVDCSRDKDEPPDRDDAGRPKVRWAADTGRLDGTVRDTVRHSVRH